MNADRLLNGLTRVGMGLGLGAYVVQSTIYTVYPGQRAVMYDRLQGVKDGVVAEGTHFRVPFIQTPHIYDLRLKPRTISTETGTKDVQNVSISLRVLSTPKEESLPALYMQYGLDYDERVLPSIGNEVLKGVVAQFDAAQLITMREVVSQKVREQLTQRATDFGIVLKDVAITHLAFGDEFTKAIESKQVMYQEAERSKYVVQKSDQLRKAAVIKAEGDAEYASLMQEATKNSPGFLELRKIEASKEIVNKLSDNPNISYIPKDGNFILGLGGSGRI